jgi:hypothetical protein
MEGDSVARLGLSTIVLDASINDESLVHFTKYLHICIDSNLLCKVHPWYMNLLKM